MEDTKQRILEKSLELFSAKGYDAVSVGEIAKAVGIKAPSLYNHFPSKQAIFDAIVESTAAHYEKDTGWIDIHVQNVKQDCPTFSHIPEQALADKVRQIFLYSLHDKQVSQFRRMMTLEQFRSPELAALFSERYVDRMISYHACGGIMEPVAVWVRKGGEWAIIHRCKRCGKLSSNRVAADDNPMKLMSIAMKLLCSPPFPLDYLEEMTALMGGDGRMR